MNRRTVIGWATAALVVGLSSVASAEEPPIKIGMSMPQTGGLAGGGKASLLGIEIWRDDINAKGGLLGRKVELVVYDDKSSASETPAIYAKLLDVDKVDLLFAPYATVPTAPIMPLVKQRGLLLMGNFSFQVNSKVHHDMWFNNAPWGPADSWATGFLDARPEGRRQDHGAALGRPGVRPEPGDDRARRRQRSSTSTSCSTRSYPPSTAEFSSIVRALSAAKPDIVFVASYPPDSAGILRAVNEIGIGDNVKIFGGAMVGLQFARGHGEHGIAAQRRRQLQHVAARTEHVLRRHQGVLREIHQARRRGEGRSARLLSRALWLCHGPDDRAGGQRDQIARPEGLAKYLHANTHEDHRWSDLLCATMASGSRA